VRKKKDMSTKRYRCCKGTVKGKDEGKEHLRAPVASPHQDNDQLTSTGVFLRIQHFAPSIEKKAQLLLNQRKVVA
jgi:hypothetical protein